MLIGVPKETAPGELRVAATPASVRKLAALGYEVTVQSGAGACSGFGDDAYAQAGAGIDSEGGGAFGADVVLQVRIDAADAPKLKRGAVYLGFLDPFRAPEAVQALATAGVTAVSMEMLPRSTRAQKMDALSSQASLAGYAAVIEAAQHAPRIFPMMMTPAGTIPPARVFVIGAGVAGLQAIATARRLGARVEAFDTRPAVAEEVRSLGARFVELDVGATEQTEQGYARELSAEQLRLQREGMAKVIAQSDVVITTAQVFGRPAPRIVSGDMVRAMRPGSVVIDMAVESGGNVEGSKANAIAEVNGVKLLGRGNLPAAVAANASEMYASNLAHFVAEFSAEGALRLDGEDDIVRAAVLTRDGSTPKQPAMH